MFRSSVWSKKLWFISKGHEAPILHLIKSPSKSGCLLHIQMEMRVGIFLLASNSDTAHQIMSFIFSMFCALIRCIKFNNCTCVYECSLLHRNHQHCHLKGNLFELRLVNSTECDICKQTSETALHILWDWGHIKIQAPGLSFYKTRWLSRHLCQQDTALCSCCATAEWVS
jgi:hypothetical protein